MMKRVTNLVAIALVCLAIFLPHLDVVEVNIMEARNFITAREMLEYGNWIHTTMNLEPRYEKPPLPTWLTAFSASVFGVKSLFGLRLPAVISVIFLIFTFYFLCIRILRDVKQAFVATLILATSFYVIFSGRNGQWDIFAHAFMLYAIYQLFLAFESDKPGWKHWLGSGLFLGLSFMSKGPISMYALLLPFLIAYGIAFRFKGFNNKLLPLFVALVIFAVTGLTWGIYIYYTDTSSAEYIADKETLAWANRSVKPFYHYWSFFTQSGVWTFFAFIALLYPYMVKRVSHKKYYVFSMLWTLVSVVLLSLIPEKKERYLLPVLIPLAMNSSFYLYYLMEKAKSLGKADRRIANFGFGLIGLIGIAFPFGVYLYFKGDLQGYWTPFFLSSVTLFTLGVLIFVWLAKSYYERCFYGVILFICSIMLFAFPMAELLYDNEEYLPLSRLRQMEGAERLSLYSTDPDLPSPELIFDLGEPIKRVKGAEHLPQSGTFGLLVSDSVPGQVKETFRMELKADFDINNRKEGALGHKDRKTMRFYLMEKK